MRLTQIQVEGLHGIFNHTVPIKNEDRVTILIGLNGIGKTLILKIIKSFFDLDFVELIRIDFQKIIFSFENEAVHIYKTYPSDSQTELFETSEIIADELNFYFYVDGQIQEQKFKLNPQSYYRQQRRRQHGTNWTSHRIGSDWDLMIDHYLPDHIIRLESSTWYDKRSNTYHKTDEILRRYAGRIPEEFVDQFTLPIWLKRLTSSVKIKFVETQRLLNKMHSDDGKYNSAILEYSSEIKETIKTIRAKASDLASKLDRTYPKRLLERFRDEQFLDPSSLLEELLELENKRKKLTSVGLIESEDEYIVPYFDSFISNLEIQTVLKLYIDDSNAKLEIYDDLRTRISKFLEIINEKFSFKSFTIEKETGFVFKSTLDGRDIPLGSLSSGEQHELVLFYKLLFNTSTGTLLLIDEPEISLHISWQNKFIEDLMQVIKINPIDIIIATHSPDIIGAFWDLSVKLDAENDSSSDIQLTLLND